MGAVTVVVERGRGHACAGQAVGAGSSVHLAGEVRMRGVDARVDDGDLRAARDAVRARIDGPAVRGGDLRERPLRRVVLIVRRGESDARRVVRLRVEHARPRAVPRDFPVEILPFGELDDQSARRELAGDLVAVCLNGLPACPGLRELDQDRRSVARRGLPAGERGGRCDEWQGNGQDQPQGDRSHARHVTL
jgi:hypothetical protein